LDGVDRAPPHEPLMVSVITQQRGDVGKVLRPP
jgi:hypothetical protein